MPTIDSTVAGPSANSYCSLVEAATYFDERLPLSTPWVASGDTSVRALIQATRVLDMVGVPHREIRTLDGVSYFYVGPQWAGTPATSTQRLVWPRTGMYDRNGNAIPSNTIPRELKEAQAELAGQLVISDTTLDNSVAVSGLLSVKAGSVALTFKDMIERHVVPDIVMEMLPASWFTDATTEAVTGGEENVDVVSE